MSYPSFQFLTTEDTRGRTGLALIEFVAGARNAIGSTAVEFVVGVNL